VRSALRVSTAFSAGHLDQLLIEILVWDGDLDRLAWLAAVEPLTDDLGFDQLFRQQHLIGDEGRLGVELLDELGQHFFIGLIAGALQNEVLAPRSVCRSG
jgi:hypothetical protein